MKIISQDQSSNFHTFSDYLEIAVTDNKETFSDELPDCITTISRKQILKIECPICYAQLNSAKQLEHHNTIARYKHGLILQGLSSKPQNHAENMVCLQNIFNERNTSYYGY